MKQTGKLCSVLLLMSMAVGCSWTQVLATAGLGAAAGAGIAAVYYTKGDLEADLDYDLERIETASLSVLENRAYRVTDKTGDEKSRRIKATIPAAGDEEERDLTIILERKKGDISHIFIRVGIFGDESLSRAILYDIESNLNRPGWSSARGHARRWA